jgi:hypothetical protein
MLVENDMTQERYRGISARKNQAPQTNFQLGGVWLHLARGAWIAFVLAELVIILLTLFESFRYGLTICPWAATSCFVTPAAAQALHLVGIAPASYATYNLVLTLFQALILLGIGGLLFWRKSREPLCLAASFVFVTIGLWPFFTSTYPPAVAFGHISATYILPLEGYFLVTFPDGRFVPRWSWLLVVLWVAQTIVFQIPGPFNILSWPPPLFAAELLLTYGGTVGVQIYRYVRASSYSQRQQTKWLVFGLAGCIVLFLLYNLIGNLFPGLGAPDSPFQLVSGTITFFYFLIVPLSIGIAIQRSRLWDIDLLINRTLVYGTLTVILTVAYVSLILGLQALLHGFISQDNSIAIVISTLAIAALFQPLRARIQRIIDRRFYRSKYDAAKIIEAFSATLRTEIDLNQLSAHLVSVVEETIQPSSISLWLRQPERRMSLWDQKPFE